MGKRGPVKTPTAVLEKRGSWLAKTREDEPQADGAPVKPDGMSQTAEAIWDRLVPRLSAMGVVGEVDSMAVSRYCDLLALYEDCRSFIQKHGQVMPQKDDAGKVVGFKEFPQVSRMSRIADQLLRLEQQYGMTASARASLAVDTTKQNKKDDGIESILNPLKLA